jgi:nitroreductase
MTDGARPTGLEALMARPLLETILRRRTHRVSKGVQLLKAGSMTYESNQAPAPLSELEEAILIAVTGHTGLTMPDRPFQDPKTGEMVMAKPNLTMEGRSAGSPDNAQGTSFFMINDSGTYFLRKLPPADRPAEPTPESLVARAKLSKVRVLDKRIDTADREFPAYLDSNRFLSNLPGTTLFFPVVDLSHQYINGLMYLLTQPDGRRPTLVDDRNFYRKAGVERWVRKGFLNGDIKIPLGVVGTLRTQIEADLLLQNLMLVAEAMGLGAYIHGSVSPPVLLGAPNFVSQYGRMLGFDFATPPFRLLDVLRWQIPPLPKYENLRAHPIGLKVGDEYLIRAKCPPYFPSMKEAVEDVVSSKFGNNGIYKDSELFAKIYKGDYGETYLKGAPKYSDEVVECVRDVCQYIFDTHGRFPAHVDAIYVPGVWIQIHHPDIEYYDRYFQNGLTQAHREHHQQWHPDTPASP